MKNLFKHAIATMAILSFIGCDYPSQSPESVAESYVQALHDNDADAVYETLALPDNPSALTVKVSKEYIQRYIDFNNLLKNSSYSIKDAKVLKKTDIDATVVVYYEDQEHKEDSTKVYLISDRKTLKTWRVFEPTTFPFQLISDKSE